MRRWKSSFRILFFLFYLCEITSATPTIKGNKTHIPFEYINNFIVIDVQFQKSLPLKFIFDTGAENTIITNKTITDIFNIPYERIFEVLGSDLKNPMKAYLVKNIHLKMRDFISSRTNLLVLEEDYVNFKSLMGVDIQGIIGGSLFKNFIVQINYKKKVITLHRYETFKSPKGYQKIKVDIHKSKPYIACPTVLHDGTELPLVYLMDTGASLFNMLHNNTHESMQLPENFISGNIGMGLGGVIQGYFGRVPGLQFGNFRFNNIVSIFHDLPEPVDSLVVLKNGILGNKLLEFFHIIIDYHHEYIYLKPNQKIESDFTFDRSGLNIMGSGPKQNVYVVNEVIKGSPADEAGFMTGDVIHKIGALPRLFYSLNQLNRKLRQKGDKKIVLTIKRGQEKLKKTFFLRDII